MAGQPRRSSQKSPPENWLVFAKRARDRSCMLNAHPVKIIVHGGPAATEAFLESCASIRTMTKDIYAPAEGESVQIGQNTNSYSVSLSDEMLASVRMSRVGHPWVYTIASLGLTFWFGFSVRGQRGWLCHGTDHHKRQRERARTRTDQPSLRLCESPFLDAATGARCKTDAALAPLDDDRRAETHGAQGSARHRWGAGGVHWRRCARLSRGRRRDRFGT